MITTNFTFRSGKHKNKSYEWVFKNDPGYIEWVLEARPEMLQTKPIKNKQISKKTYNIKEDNEIRFKPLKPNLYFEKEIIMEDSIKSSEEIKIKKEIIKMKMGMYSKYMKETWDNGNPKYDKFWLIDIVFNPEDEEELNVINKIKNKLNGN